MVSAADPSHHLAPYVNVEVAEGRLARPVAEACSELRKAAGSQLDPVMVDALLAAWPGEPGRPPS
ncbi:MAG TPA: hypothetical protein VF834_10515 [Streptosporangiaceae bacterium]